MPEAQWTGLAAVLAGGFLQGAFMLPMKWTRAWAWENTWLVFASTAYLICPWLLVFMTMPQAFDIYGAVGAAALVKVLLFGVGWGVGAVTFGLGVDAVGLALGFATILGIAATVGTLIPMFTAGVQSLSAARVAMTLLSLVVMLSGVAVCSFAGRWKEQARDTAARLTYRQGILVCVISGLLSACGNLGFVVGTPIIETAQSFGVPQDLASNVVWALLTVAMFVCNAGYSVLLLRRNGTTALYGKPGTRAYWIFGALTGALWMGGFVLYGAGARRLGPLGPSLGWAIFMSTMVLTANGLGLATGEWSAAPPAARRRLWLGIALLLAAIVGLGAANSVG